MTEKLLRDTLLEAQEKDQLGLLIWQTGQSGMIWVLK